MATWRTDGEEDRGGSQEAGRVAARLGEIRREMLAAVPGMQAGRATWMVQRCCLESEPVVLDNRLVFQIREGKELRMKPEFLV